jgi:hypothetical protein
LNLSESSDDFKVSKIDVHNNQLEENVNWYVFAEDEEGNTSFFFDSFIGVNIGERK